MAKKTIEINCSLFKRTLAFLIDILILDVIVFSPITNYLSKILPESISDITFLLDNNPQILSKVYSVIIFMTFIAIIYFSFMEYYFGGTPGKMFFGVYVKKTTLIKIIISNLVLIPFFPFILFWIIEPLYLVFTNRRILEKWTQVEIMERVQI